MIVHPDYLLTRERLALYEAFLVHLRRRIEQDAGGMSSLGTSPRGG